MESTEQHVADEVEPNFEAFAAHPAVRDLPKSEQHALYRRRWSMMIDAKTAGRDTSYSESYWMRAIRGKGVKGHGRNYGDMTTATEETAS